MALLFLYHRLIVWKEMMLLSDLFTWSTSKLWTEKRVTLSCKLWHNLVVVLMGRPFSTINFSCLKQTITHPHSLSPSMRHSFFSSIFTNNLGLQRIENNIRFGAWAPIRECKFPKRHRHKHCSPDRHRPVHLPVGKLHTKGCHLLEL